MTTRTVFLLGLLGFNCQVGCSSNKYDNYTLLKITPHNEHHLKVLTRLSDADGLEILKRSHGLNDTTDVLVSPHKKSDLEFYAAANGMPVEYKRNYGRNFEYLDSPPKEGRRGFEIYNYNSYGAIKGFIRSLSDRFPNLVSLEDVGTSYEGRKMQLVKISLNPSAGNPIAFIDAGIHAREWVAPAMAVYLIHRLTTDPNAPDFELKGLDWYILPLMNPDGYEYSRLKRDNRLWRKTRSKSEIPGCFGVDLNRNFGYKWGVSGMSHDPCEPYIYAGPKAFSEAEARVVRDIMTIYSKRIKLYVSLHSYGHYILFPWGYTADTLPKTWRRMSNLAKMASDSVVRAGGRSFNVMSGGQWYPTSGASNDYAFGDLRIPYSYIMELTDGFEFTFPKQILHIVLPQYYEAFKTFSVQIKHEFRA